MCPHKKSKTSLQLLETIQKNPAHIDPAVATQYDFTRDLTTLMANIVKLNKLLRGIEGDFQENVPEKAVEKVLSPDFAHKYIDANALIANSVLTDGDVDVLMLLGDGMTLKEVSEELGLTETELDNLMQDIVKKIGPALNLVE